jgi:hypothetical protein
MALSLSRVIQDHVQAPALRSFHVLVEGSDFDIALGEWGRLNRFTAWRRVQATSETEARIAARERVAKEWADSGWATIAGQARLSTPLASRLTLFSRWAARDTPLAFSRLD